MDDDDIPNLDELQWLDSNLPLSEDEYDDQYFFAEATEPIPQPVPPQQHSPIIPTSMPYLPLNKTIQENKAPPKRPLLNPEVLVSEKRSKVSVGDNGEEEWLRYTPVVLDVEVNDVVGEETEKEKEKFVSRFASEIEGECVPVTSPCGKRVYAKVSRLKINDVAKKLDVKGYPHGLISEPFNILKAKLEQGALLKALQDGGDSPNDSIQVVGTPVVSEQLWVEKYAPSSFTDLLSDERTNREVLLWLKQWDTSVFGSKIVSTEDDVLSALKRHSSLSHQQKGSGRGFSNKNRGTSWNNKSFDVSENYGHENNSFEVFPESWNKKPITTGPPDQKVLLLCGPPGLGKTTLAHVAAKHCGYRVVEINASDDRSSSSVEAKILDVIQMNSVMADAKPKCLVIDEIDGSLGEGKGAVEAILKMITTEKKYEVGKRSGMQEEPGKGSSKKRRKSASLCRPVICICNDLYAPALRPLRQVAKVHVFLQPTVSRVVNRLKYICSKEKFRTKSAGLTALAEYTECDIRSCLNTLQFLNKKKETLNELEIGSQVIGRKDMSRSVFDVWKEIFQKRKVKREKAAIDSRSLMSREFDSLQSLISNCGEYELTMDGIHENVLHFRYHDPMMQKTVECLNILGMSDYFHKHIMRTQQMSLLAYQPSNAIAIHRLVSQFEKPMIEWPKSFHRYRMALTEKKDLLKCWQNKISPYISRHLTTECFVEDAVSPLLHILSPPTLRPVALHLQSERENAVLSQLIDTMLSYTITYKNSILEIPPSTLRHEASVDTSTLIFDPPINEFINFKDYTSGHFGLSLAMKQVVLHKVEKQKILGDNMTKPTHLDNGSNMIAHDFPETQSDKMFSAKTVITTAFSSMEHEKIKSHPEQNVNSVSKVLASESNKISTIDEKLGPKDVPKRSGGSSCFFDRFRKSGGKNSQNTEDVKKSATIERDSRPLLFKYNEGFTNAVKRPVRIRDLLL